MTIFGHEKLDVYRAALEYVAYVYRLAECLTANHRRGEPTAQTTPQPHRRNANQNALKIAIAIAIVIAIGFDSDYR